MASPKPFDPDYMRRLRAASEEYTLSQHPRLDYRRILQKYGLDQKRQYGDDFFRLRLIQRRGVPELLEAVYRGQIVLDTANTLSHASEQEQRDKVQFILTHPRSANGRAARLHSTYKVSPTAEILDRHLGQLEEIVAIIDSYSTMAYIRPLTQRLQDTNHKLSKIINRWRVYNYQHERKQLSPQRQGTDQLRQPAGVGAGNGCPR